MTGKNNIGTASLMHAFTLMSAKYGPQHWWPSDSPWETCVGAVLTQNTSWKNVEIAISSLKNSGCLDAEKLLGMQISEIESHIRPSGYFRLKTARLLELAKWWVQNTSGGKIKTPSRNLAETRKSVLSIKGVGPETADCILLYAFELPVFVIDAYTRRIMARHFGTPLEIDYHELQSVFMKNLPHDVKLFNEFHALFVAAAKYHCRKNECSRECPLRAMDK